MEIRIQQDTTIYQSGGTINLNADEQKNITFNGTITGAGSNSININDIEKNDAVGGTYNFNNTISNTTVNVQVVRI